MNVLSCFDGMSCGQIALNRAGIPYDKYFASEIDKHAIAVTMANYPDTIQLGDITKVKVDDLPEIGMMIGGSPCQGFSFAGKGLNFDDPRSKLFFIFADLLDAVKPKWFLLENVRMKKWCERIITERLQVDPIFIDSARVSAQTRKRLYWTNIPVVGKPKDLGIYLKDILEDEVDKKYYLSEKTIAAFTAHAERNKENGNGFGWNIRTVIDKSAAIPTGSFKSTSTFVKSEKALAVLTKGGDKMANFDEIRSDIAASRGRGSDNTQSLEVNPSGKSIALTSVTTDNLIVTHCTQSKSQSRIRETSDGFHLARNDAKQSSIQGTHATYPEGKVHAVAAAHTPMTINDLVFKENYVQWDVSGKGHNSQQDRAWYADGKSGCVAAARTESKVNVFVDSMIRRLTEIEACRLQTVPDDYFLNPDGSRIVSSSATYKALGNGWTVDVIVWIFGFMKNGEPKNGVAQKGLFD